MLPPRWLTRTRQCYGYAKRPVNQACSGCHVGGRDPTGGVDLLPACVAPVCNGGFRVQGSGFSMKRVAHPTFLSACVHAQADAPKGRRSVATGGASPAAKRAERNSWTHSHLNNPAPEAAEEASRRKQNAKVHPRTCSAYRALVNATGQSFALPGRKGDDGPVSHGFRVAPLHPWLQPVAPLGRELAP